MRITSVCVLLALVLPVSAQEKTKPAKETSTAALMKVLNTEMDWRPLQEATKLKGALEYFHERTGLIVFIDVHGFAAVNPPPMLAGGDIYDDEVQLPPIPAKMTTLTALRLIVAQVNGGNAAFVFRQGHIAIIPEQYNRSSFFLRQPIFATYEKRPLNEMLDSLAEATGLTINIDGRVSDKTKTAVSATFRNTSLEDALVVATEAADLKFVVFTNSVLVTTPDHAAALIKEQRDRQRGSDRKRK